MAGIVSPGFFGRRREGRRRPTSRAVPRRDFPVLSAGPTPRVTLDTWEFRSSPRPASSTPGTGALAGAAGRDITVDLHCVTQWSKLGTSWRGVSLDTLLDGVETAPTTRWCSLRRVHDEPAAGGPARRPGLDRLPYDGAD